MKFQHNHFPMNNAGGPNWGAIILTLAIAGAAIYIGYNALQKPITPTLDKNPENEKQ